MNDLQTSINNIQSQIFIMDFTLVVMNIELFTRPVTLASRDRRNFGVITTQNMNRQILLVQCKISSGSLHSFLEQN